MKLTGREKAVIYNTLADSTEEDMNKLNALTKSPSKLAVRLAFDSGVVREILDYLHPSLTVLVKLTGEQPPSLQREEVLTALQRQLEVAENWLQKLQELEATHEQDTANCN